MRHWNYKSLVMRSQCKVHLFLQRKWKARRRTERVDWYSPFGGGLEILGDLREGGGRGGG